MNMFEAAETSKIVDTSGCLRSSQEGMQFCGPRCCCPGEDWCTRAPQSLGSNLQLGMFR